MTNIRRWTVPLLLTMTLCLVHLVSFPARLQDAATLAPITDFHLDFPLMHVLLEPFFGLADALTLSVKWPTVIFVLWFVALLPFVKGWSRRLALFSALLLFAAWALLIPRPMGRITANNPDDLVIDFHSHSLASHDGRPSFTPEANAEWHKEQGFNASFLTDHKTVAVKTTGPFSLSGEEVSLYRMSFVVLSPKTSVDSRPYSSNPSLIEPFIKEMHRRGLLVIGVLPYYRRSYWDGQPNVEDFIRWGIDGFEISNGAPRALDFTFADRQRILALCRQHNLIFDSASDNHGYGFATANWSVVHLPGWQSLSAIGLESAVVNHLAKYRFDAVRVVERPRYRPANPFELALSPLGIAFVYARTLSWPQTVSWMVWIWGLTYLLEFLRFRAGSRRLVVEEEPVEIVS